MTLVATLLVTFGIIGLFFLVRESQVRTSKALIIPVLWLAFAGSRPMTSWLDVRVAGADQYMEGSPLDRNFYIGLIVLGILALVPRRQVIFDLLRKNGWVVLFLSY